MNNAESKTFFLRKNYRENLTQAVFEPGSKTSYEFDGQLLNANIDWQSIVKKILKGGYTLDFLSYRASIPLILLKVLIDKNINILSFKMGATLATIYTCLLSNGIEQ